MSEQSHHEQAADAPKNDRPNTGVRPRLWPAVGLLLAYLAVTYGFSLFGSTNIQSALALLAIPLATMLLLVVWWLLASRIPIRARLTGFLLFTGALVLLVFSQATRERGALLLVLAVPAITTGIVAILLATYALRWPLRRWLLAAYLVISTVFFAAMRVDSIGGMLMPATSWRWQPSADDHSKMLVFSTTQGTAVLPAKAAPEDWPAFRGAARDARRTGVTFTPDWVSAPHEMWRRKIGPGWSSFIAVGGYLFTQEQCGEEELVTCYHAATGEPVWQRHTPGRFEDGMGLGPRATPTFSDGRLYAQACTGTLQCLEASTGALVWQRDLAKDAETGIPGYGFACSPLVTGEVVVECSCGGEGKSVVAYDRATGDICWRGGHETAGYSSPHLATIADIPQVLVATDWGLQSFVPSTGACLWEYHAKVETNPRCVQPLLLEDGLVLLGATGTASSHLLRVQKNETAWNVALEWETKKFRPYFNDGVLHKGYCYGFDGERLACVNLKTGQRQWAGRLYGGQLILVADMDMLLILSEAGDVILVPATPDRFSETTRFKALTGKTWNHPVVAYGRLFVRNAEEAACFELSAHPAPGTMH